jgi:acetoin utilization deacetylase AcuC-like enzyme
MTLLYTDQLFLRHDTGRHPECADRLRAVTARLEQTGLAAKCNAAQYQPLTADDVRKIHSAHQVTFAQQVSEHGGGYLDGDTPVSKESYSVALAAAGACVAAVDAVLTGGDCNALCLVRPPGHHSTPTHSMGFCLFNNIALAAHHARTAHGLTRILIVDWDVHHGNGTQDIFYEAPEVAFYSIHRYGHGFFPGTGAADETGRGKGAGHVFNLPMRYGISRKQYRAAFGATLEKAAAVIKPELVLVSAGFDAHASDPIGSLGLETEDFTMMTGLVLDGARTHANGRLVSCLEGGYNLDALAEGIQTHLEEMVRATV